MSKNVIEVTILDIETNEDESSIVETSLELGGDGYRHSYNGGYGYVVVSKEPLSPDILSKIEDSNPLCDDEDDEDDEDNENEDNSTIEFGNNIIKISKIKL